jgi:pectate lyase-like protein
VTTYPRPTDLLTALTKADGTSEAHSRWHGRSLELAENVKGHGAKGDGVTDDTAAFQAAINTGFKVYVPLPAGGHYVISDQLVVNSHWGLHMEGAFSASIGGTGPRIVCDNFPPNTDVFRMTSPNFPRLFLDRLFFDHVNGTPPRDLFRQEVTDNHQIDWSRVTVQNMGGYGFNTPPGMQLVSAVFENCGFLGNGAGGMNIDSCTATVLRRCRFTSNGGGFDLNVAGGAGFTLDNPIMDGYAPGALNFDRMRLANIQGLQITNPYFEWGSGTATGVLRNILLNGCTSVVVTAGTGVVTPAGSPNLTAIDIQGGSNIVLLEPPIQTWGGGGTRSLNVANLGGGLVAFVADDPAKIAVDAASGPYSTIYNSGQVLRYQQTITPGNLTGATPNCKGAAAGVFTNASPTNVTNLQGAGAGGHVITLYANDSNTTLIHGANGNDGNFSLRGGTNYTLPSGAVITLMYLFGAWRESSR